MTPEHSSKLVRRVLKYPEIYYVKSIKTPESLLIALVQPELCPEVPTPVLIKLIDYIIGCPGGTDCCLRLNESEHVADLVQKIARCKSLMHLINKVRLIFTHCRLSFDDGPNDFSLPPSPPPLAILPRGRSLTMLTRQGSQVVLKCQWYADFP